MNSTFSTIVIFLIPVLFPFALAFAAAFYMSFLQRLPMQQRLIVSSMAHTIVRAVEQMGTLDMSGAQKKDQALQALMEITQGIGLKVPAPLLEVAIEASVFELHQMIPHSDQPDLTGPFAYRQTAHRLPTIPLSTTSSTAPTAPIPIVPSADKNQPIILPAPNQRQS